MDVFIIYRLAFSLCYHKLTLRSMCDGVQPFNCAYAELYHLFQTLLTQFHYDHGLEGW